MRVNVGTLDRVGRVVIGVVLIGLAATGVVGSWGFVGVVPLLTAGLGICPLYSMIGFNTCSIKKST